MPDAIGHVSLARSGQHLGFQLLHIDIPVVGIHGRIRAHRLRHVVTVVDATHHDGVAVLGPVMSGVPASLGRKRRDGFAISHQTLCDPRQRGFTLPLDEDKQHSNQPQDRHTGLAGAMQTSAPRLVWLEEVGTEYHGPLQGQRRYQLRNCGFPAETADLRMWAADLSGHAKNLFLRGPGNDPTLGVYLTGENG